MCGIGGIYRFKTNKAVTLEEVQTMCDTFEYRGPDGRGEYLNGALGLGHRRLTIIDTSERSNQPMLSADEQTVICYNGEVYNYVEMKASLSEKGIEFRTTSDTEVLLQMYRQYGKECLKEFNGMFAFAIWDKSKNEFLLARDRVGIKPLYYAIDEDGIVFASELKALLTILGKDISVNRKIIDSYMSLGYCPTNETLFDNIFKLPPGHSIEIKNGELKVEEYWDLSFDKSEDKGEAFYVKEAEKLFKDAVKLQLRSDVPLGVFLSGGIDSSAVVAMMRELGVKDIKTFSVAWDYGNNFNETQYARQVAEQYGTDHHEHFMTAEDFKNFLPQYIRHMDEPVTEAAAISLYFLAKKTKEKVTVVLSGEGSDEVFGGYPIYKYMQVVENYKKVPAFLRKKIINPLARKLGPKFAKYADLSEVGIEESYFGVSFYQTKQKRALYTDAFREECDKYTIVDALAPYYQKTEGHDLQTRMQYVDYKSWLVDDLLIKADRMSMAASLELRVPFLDHRMLEFTAKMPSKYRIKNGEPKYIIKKAMEPYLSDEILYRKKMGFPTPLAIMFQDELKDYVASIIDSERAYARGYFNPQTVRRLIDEHAGKKADHHKILWQLLVLELWHREFVDQNAG